MSPVPLYDALASDYDRFVDWPGRLAHELPFIERFFREHRVRRVLDAACGTGRHAIALAQKGYEAVGADLSPAMIEHARLGAAAAGVDVPFFTAGFGDLAALGQTFDAILCLGNSLPHVLTDAELAAALADFAALLRPGGLLVAQNRNFDRIWARRERFMGPQVHREGDREWLFVRFYDFHADTLTFNMIRLQRTPAGWSQDVEATELRPIFADQLAAALALAGLASVELYGGYDGAPFDPEVSGDLIAVAARVT
jgi:SAM-dependent methyltransferase